MVYFTNFPCGTLSFIWKKSCCILATGNLLVSCENPNCLGIFISATVLRVPEIKIEVFSGFTAIMLGEKLILPTSPALASTLNAPLYLKLKWFFMPLGMMTFVGEDTGRPARKSFANTPIFSFSKLGIFKCKTGL